MPIVDFPFERLSTNDIKRPILFLQITNPQTGFAISSRGIIDTGADRCAIPKFYADFLGYDLKSGKPKKINTGNGITRAYSHPCKIDIYDTNSIFKPPAHVVYTTSVIQIDFMENLNVILLGVRDFLGQFYLGVDYKNQMFCARS